MEEHLHDFPDLIEHHVGPTRGDRSIDRIFSNLRVAVSGTVPPLETDLIDGVSKKSDHKVAFVQSELDRVQEYEMLNYRYRFYNAESELQYGKWLGEQDWSDLMSAEGSEEKTNVYQDMVVGALERFFPLVTVRRKSTDPPWYN